MTQIKNAINKSILKDFWAVLSAPAEEEKPRTVKIVTRERVARNNFFRIYKPLISI